MYSQLIKETRMSYAYHITLEVRTKKALGTDQQDKLRDAVLDALDTLSDRIPYGADVVTAEIGCEEKL